MGFEYIIGSNNINKIIYEKNQVKFSVFLRKLFFLSDISQPFDYNNVGKDGFVF